MADAVVRMLCIKHCTEASLPRLMNNLKQDPCQNS